MTITEVKTKLLSLVDEIQAGDEIEITRRGVVVARLAPARGPHALKDKFAGIAKTAPGVQPEDLYGTDWHWE
jgi:antitoxin (DNA-binding transcriptional repressor) of toxin-antitoxin stability system